MKKPAYEDLYFCNDGAFYRSWVGDSWADEQLTRQGAKGFLHQQNPELSAKAVNKLLDGMIHKIVQREAMLPELRKEPHDRGIVEKDGVFYRNLYRPSTFPLVEGDYSKITEIMRFTSGGGDAEYYWLLEFYKHKLQHPESLSKGLCIHGGKGTAKSSQCDWFSTILGTHNTIQIGSEDLDNDFNALFANKLLVIADEALTSKTKLEQAQKIKRLITEQYINSNEKHTKKVRIINRMVLIFLSNFLTPMTIEPGCRRITVVSDNLKLGQPPPKEYSDMLESLYVDSTSHTLNAEGKRQVSAWGYMLANDVCKPEVIRNVLQNEARARLIATTTDSAISFVKEIESGSYSLYEKAYLNTFHNYTLEDTWLFGPRGVSKKFITGMYEQYCKDYNLTKVDGKRFHSEVTSLGWTESRDGNFGPRTWIGEGLPKRQQTDRIDLQIADIPF
jgi:hypothetical protein